MRVPLPRACAAWIGCLFGALSSGCISGGYEGRHRLSEPDLEAVAQLAQPQTGVEAVLTDLGAPLYVWEYRRTGAALAWGGFDSTEWDVAGSLPVDRASVSLSYGSVSAGLRGVVLFFDEAWRLQFWRKGVLSEIFEGVRRSNNLVGDDEVHGPSA